MKLQHVTFPQDDDYDRQERSAILEFDGGLTREAAERAAGIRTATMEWHPHNRSNPRRGFRIPSRSIREDFERASSRSWGVRNPRPFRLDSFPSGRSADRRTEPPPPNQATGGWKLNRNHRQRGDGSDQPDAPARAIVSPCSTRGKTLAGASGWSGMAAIGSRVRTIPPVAQRGGSACGKVVWKSSEPRRPPTG